VCVYLKPDVQTNIAQPTRRQVTITTTLDKGLHKFSKRTSKLESVMRMELLTVVFENSKSRPGGAAMAKGSAFWKSRLMKKRHSNRVKQAIHLSELY
jgi:hypothetical protein